MPFVAADASLGAASIVGDWNLQEAGLGCLLDKAGGGTGALRSVVSVGFCLSASVVHNRGLHTVAMTTAIGGREFCA